MAKYVGGPCDGLGVGNQTGPTLVCASTSYSRGADGDYHVTVTGGGSADAAHVATHGHRGWADLQKSVNRETPTVLARAKAVNRATARNLAKRRRLV